jgi:3-mercaptopyruvate sulfurtransferase SseA
MLAARLWYILSYLGVLDVRILDGGLAAWQSQGLPTAEALSLPRPLVVATLGPHTLRHTWRVYRHDVDPVRDGATLVDVRSQEEYEGTDPGEYDLRILGRIESSVWGGDGDGASHIYHQPDGHFQPLATVAMFWRGLPNDTPRIYYCGNGYRSSVALFFAVRLGRIHDSNYSDGWLNYAGREHIRPQSVVSPEPSCRAK